MWRRVVRKMGEWATSVCRWRQHVTLNRGYVATKLRDVKYQKFLILVNLFDRHFTEKNNISSWHMLNAVHWRAVINGCLAVLITGYAVAQLVEAMRYKPEGRGIDSRWVIGILHRLNPSGRTEALGSTQTNRNEYQGSSLRGKAVGAYDWQPYHLRVPTV